MFSTKVNLWYLLYSTAWRYCHLHLIKQNCLLKTFLSALILKTQVSLYLLSRVELNWICKIFLWLPKCLKRWLVSIVLQLWLWRTVSLNFLTYLLNSSDCWKVSSVAPVFKDYGGRSKSKNYCPVSLLCVISKVFEKL